MTTIAAPILDAALELAFHGFRVLPLCGKVPILLDWPKRATTDAGDPGRGLPK